MNEYLFLLSEEYTFMNEKGFMNGLNAHVNFFLILALTVNHGVFLIVVRDLVPFPTGGACCSWLGLSPLAYQDRSAWEM